MKKVKPYPGTYEITETFQDNSKRVTHLFAMSSKDLFLAVMECYGKDKAEQKWFQKYREHSAGYRGKLAGVTVKQANITADACDNTVVVIKRYAESVEWNPREKETGYREWTIPARDNEKIRDRITSLFRAESFSLQEAGIMAKNIITQLKNACPGQILSLAYGVGEIEFKIAS